MKYIHKYNRALKAIAPNASFGLSGNDEDSMQIINWSDDNISQPTDAEVKSKITEMETAEANEATAKANLKASAKAKLVAGEPLTEEEANTIVL